MTDLGEKERLSITAVDKHEARGQAKAIIADGRLGLIGTRCDSIEVQEA